MFPIPLPTELALLIISNLSVSSIRSLLLTSKEWLNFINQNRSTIYRHAAVTEGYLDTGVAPGVDELVADPYSGRRKSTLYSQRAMKGVNGWLDFCKQRKLVERSWAGRACSAVVPSPRPGMNRPESPNYKSVHRIKVDENAGITMATTHMGGLVVRDLESDEVLWELPTWYVRGYAHLEYSEGYMIFDRHDGNKEVWRRTVEIGDGERGPELEVEQRSKPDQLQNQVANYIQQLGRNTGVNRKALFTPHAVLHMPESTRAYRFVFPTLLVASLERAYLVDVRTGGLVQMISDIQIIHSHESEHNSHPSSNEDEEVEEEDVEVADASDNETGEDDEYAQPTRFLGLIRYVDLSERHVFFAGRYLLRIFSRETGKCVMDIPSTRWRYGRWRWEVASRESVGGMGNCDSYPKARVEDREVVRMPTRFCLEEYSKVTKIVIDQFVAVHVSSDGKHLVAMLSGSRLVIMHNFEAFLDRPVDPLSLSNNSHLPAAMESKGTNSSSLASSSSAAPSETTQSSMDADASYTRPHETRRHRINRGREAAKSLRRAKDAKDKEIFENTIDVQLGAPSASSSIYLSYENGRIGVVTSNAVYIVIPPTPPSIKETVIDIPALSIMRLPFFSNPSWLSEVSCLMMSDTGLYLNWNPSSPLHSQMVPHIMEGPEDMPTGEEQMTILSSDDVSVTGSHTNSEDRLLETTKRAWIFLWESEYEHDLVEYEKNEDSRYLTTPSGDIFVTPRSRDLITSDLSTIYRVDFLSRCVNDERQ